MQDNGAALVGWAVISITIIHAHKKAGHGATFLCLITKFHHKLAGILYVDDTDIKHLNMEAEESEEEAHAVLQNSVNSWSELLMATGGALKPEKCFYNLVSFVWDWHSKWTYSDNHMREELGITTPLPSGARAPINHLAVTEGKVTLGVKTAPVGDGKGPLTQMVEKSMVWANKAKNLGLRPHKIHDEVKFKFWPAVKYGLCANPAKYKDLVTTMHKPYYTICPLFGVL
jgi:hypothetical protein